MNWKTLLCSLALTATVWADDFSSANALYDAGQFAVAATAFAKVEPKTAAVWFNTGNAQYRAGQLGRAVLSYERARQLSPGDPDILANLKFTEAKLGVEEVNQSSRPVTRLIQSVAESRTLAQWSRYEVVGVWASVLGIAAAVWWPRWRTGLVLLTVVAGIGLVMATAAVIYRTVQPATAIMLATKTDARFAPQAEATVHFQLVEGTKVFIRESRGEWLLVERADEQQGWVKTAGVERVAWPLLK